MENIIQSFCALMACVGFAFVFRIHHNFRFIIIGSLGGMLGWIVYLLCHNLQGDFVKYFIAMIFVALFAEIMARVFKAPATIFLIIGCFPLVPGNGIYETMSYCISGNTDMFVTTGIHTLGISTTLALAILIVSTLFKVIKKVQKGELS